VKREETPKGTPSIPFKKQKEEPEADSHNQIKLINIQREFADKVKEERKEIEERQQAQQERKVVDILATMMLSNRKKSDDLPNHLTDKVGDDMQIWNKKVTWEDLAIERPYLI